MKKGFLTNKFLGACLLGLSFLTAPIAFSSEGEAKCDLPQGLMQDRYSNTWISIKTQTSDGAEIKFDLALKYKFSKTARDYNNAFCAGFEGNLYRLTRHKIQDSFIKTSYVDLAKKAPFILRQAVDNTKKQVNSIMGTAHRNFSVSIDGIGLRNVTATGLDANNSLRLLTKSINYSLDYDKEQVRNKSFITRDGLNIRLILDFNYIVSPKTYAVTGPDDKGIYLDVLEVVRESFAKEIEKYNLEDIAKNLDVIRDKAYLQASRHAQNCPNVYLLDIGIRQINKGKETSSLLPLSSVEYVNEFEYSPHCGA